MNVLSSVTEAEMAFLSGAAVLATTLGYKLVSPQNTSGFAQGILHVLEHTPWFASMIRNRRTALNLHQEAQT